MMAPRSWTLTTTHPCDCLAAARKVSGVKILCAVSGTRAAISGQIEVSHWFWGFSEGLRLRASLRFWVRPGHFGMGLNHKQVDIVFGCRGQKFLGFLIFCFLYNRSH